MVVNGSAVAHQGDNAKVKAGTKIRAFTAEEKNVVVKAH
jgi:hypothetical protein